jgi:hypothetical protein
LFSNLISFSSILLGHKIGSRAIGGKGKNEGINIFFFFFFFYLVDTWAKVRRSG